MNIVIVGGGSAGWMAAASMLKQVPHAEITLIDTETDFVENEHLLYLKIIYRYNFDNSIDAIQLNYNS